MKKIRQDYRQRVFHCSSCDLHIEVLGKGPVGKCPCCKKPVSGMKKLMDNLVSVKKTVIPNPNKSEE